VSQLGLALLLLGNGWLRVRLKADPDASKEKGWVLAKPIQFSWEEEYEKHSC
jgi:hypothetical protein